MNKKYLELLQKIYSEKIPIFIFGGFAEEALLFGKTTREHEDIDVLVIREDTDKYAKFFQKFGFQDYEIYLHDPNGNPTVLHSENPDGLAIEICIFEKNEKGDIYFDIFGETGEEKFRIYLPKDALTYKKTSLENLQIQTVSPLAQYQIRAGLGITNTLGPFRDKDVKSQKELKDKFFKSKSSEELKPRVEKL